VQIVIMCIRADFQTVQSPPLQRCTHVYRLDSLHVPLISTVCVIVYLFLSCSLFPVSPAAWSTCEPVDT
jgi:hypothetical protein